MKRRILCAALLVGGLLSSGVSANPLTERVLALYPTSTSARVSTGPILASTDGLTLHDGTHIAVEEIGNVTGAWEMLGQSELTAQLFRVKDVSGQFMGSGPFCEGLTYLSAHVKSGDVTLSFFSGDTQPTDAQSENVCATMSYSTRGPELKAPEGAVPVGDASADASKPVPAKKGKWTLQTDSNPLDDSKTVVVRLEADTGRSRFGENITFIGRCRSNETEAYVVWNDYLGDDSRSVYEDWKYVTIRLGDGKAQRQKWSLSTDSKATFAPGWAGNLLKEMLKHDKMVLQTTPYNESPVTAEFDIRHLDGVLGELAETCNWSY